MNRRDKSIVFVETYYPNFLKTHKFDELPAFEESYFTAQENLEELGFGTGANYTRAFNSRGWNAQLIVPNSLRSQSAWAKENLDWEPFSRAWKYGLHISRLPFLRNHLSSVRHMHRVLLEQVKKLKPLALVVQDINLIPESLAVELKKYCGVLIGEIASPPPPAQYFRGYDFIISALPSILEYAERLGKCAYYVPLAFDQRWSSNRPYEERDIDAVFIGSFSRHQPGTIPLLKEVAAHVENFEIYGPGDEKLMRAEGLASNFKGEAWGAKMFEILGRSKISLNRHGTIAGNYSVNMRMYEATGSGSLLVTEESENISELFTPGVEVLTYKSKTDAGRIVFEALENPEHSKRIAALGHSRTLRNHTYENRVDQIESLILGFI